MFLLITSILLSIKLSILKLHPSWAKDRAVLGPQAIGNYSDLSDYFGDEMASLSLKILLLLKKF